MDGTALLKELEDEALDRMYKHTTPSKDNVFKRSKEEIKEILKEMRRSSGFTEGNFEYKGGEIKVHSHSEINIILTDK